MNKDFWKGFGYAILFLVMIVGFIDLLQDKKELNDQGCYMQLDNDIVCVEEEDVV